MKKLNKNSIVTAIVIFSMALGFGGPIGALAATAPSLGAAAPYGVAATTVSNSNTAPQTIVNGSLCGTTLNVPLPLTITGTTDTPCDPQVGLDQNAALNNVVDGLNTQACTPISGALNAVIIGTNPAGTFPPGCYATTGAMDITLSTTVTLDLTAPGGTGDAWIFKSTGALTSGNNSFVVLANGADANKVFWAPVGLATLGAYTTGGIPPTTPTFVGNILDAAGITMGHFANLLGRALAFGETVTLDANTITVPTPSPTPTPTPTPATSQSSNSYNTITVFKQVINDNGGTAVFSDFRLFLNGNSVVSGQSVALAPGAYTLTETNLPGYTVSYTGNCNANGVINHGGVDTQNNICTIVNNDDGVPAVAPVPPLIDVVKIPSPLALPNGAGMVEYTYTLRNIGTVPVTDVTLIGDTCSPIVFVSGDTNGDAKLDTSEVWVYRCSNFTAETHTNTVIATGRANGLTAVDAASATVVVGAPIVPPLIHIVKVPNPLTLPVGAGAVTYQYTLTNPGTAPLSNVTVTDDKCTGLPGRVAGHPGDLNQNNLLESNESWSFTCQTNLNSTITNTAVASGQANGLTATDFALATVVVAVPKLPDTGIAPVVAQLSRNTVMLMGILGIAGAALWVLVIKRKAV